MLKRLFTLPRRQNNPMRNEPMLSTLVLGLMVNSNLVLKEEAWGSMNEEVIATRDKGLRFFSKKIVHKVSAMIGVTCLTTCRLNKQKDRDAIHQFSP